MPDKNNYEPTDNFNRAGKNTFKKVKPETQKIIQGLISNQPKVDAEKKIPGNRKTIRPEATDKALKINLSGLYSRKYFVNIHINHRTNLKPRYISNTAHTNIVSP